MDIISIGECMIEMFCEGPLSKSDTFTKAFAGDTMNMLVSASRLGAKTGYITHVGDDPFKDFLLNSLPVCILFRSYQMEIVNLPTTVRAAPPVACLQRISILPISVKPGFYMPAVYLRLSPRAAEQPC